MGRKIPGKKHRTIKNPDKQREARLLSLKDKINNPPQNASEQEVPRSLQNIMDLKTKTKKGVFDKAIRKKGRTGVARKSSIFGKTQSTYSDKKDPNLVRKPNESAVNFLRRMNLMAQNLIDEAEFEKKFHVKIKKDEETGEVIELKKLKSKRKTSKKKKLSEKRKEKELKKKENLNNIKDFSQLKDKVEFGEVVHRPPNLKKVNDSQKYTKPKFSNLYCYKIAGNPCASVGDAQKLAVQKEKSENERKFIVEAYRKVKNKR